MRQVNDVERLLIEDGINVIKIYLSISKEEQAARLEERRSDPLKHWKMGSLDQQAQDKWDDYTKYIELLFEKSSSALAPWIEVKTDSKKKARLAVMKHILCKIQNYSVEGLTDDIDVIIKHQ